MSESKNPIPDNMGYGQEIGDVQRIDTVRERGNQEIALSGESIQLRTAESVGAERLERATQWMSGKYEKAKATMGKAGGFLKRLGLKMLAPDVVAADAAAAGKKQYEHVSGAVKSKAEAAGNKASEAWGRVVETKNNVLDGVKERYNNTVESATRYRDSVIERIKDAKLKSEISAINRSLREAQARIENIDNIASQLGARREALQSTIGQIQDKLNEVAGRAA